MRLFLIQDKEKISCNKTPKLDRSEGGKEVKEKASKRKLPFTIGVNSGDQKDSDTGKTEVLPKLYIFVLILNAPYPATECLVIRR